MSSPIVTLTTDFGDGGYVGAMKGVVLAISPDTVLVDISHDVPPQDIAHGAFVLGSAYRYFAPSTVHVGVVDPGVGTSRRALLVITPAGRFLAPDNGLLTYVLADHQCVEPSQCAVVSEGKRFMAPLMSPVPEGCSAYALCRPEYWRHPVSDTFHGRDILAPVAAHLSRGVPPGQLGDAVGEVVCFSVPPPVRESSVLIGRIIFIDRFGNVVSNIRSSHLACTGVEVEIGGRVIKGLSHSYAKGEALVALIGSHGYLEVAERNGSAASRLKVGVGANVRLTPTVRHAPGASEAPMVSS